MQSLGCLTCAIAGHGYAAPDIHHLLEAGRRLGHDQTIALCPWHHRGVAHSHAAPSLMEHLKGPSLAIDSRAFHARYGDDQSLLDMQNERLAKYRETITGRSA